MDTVKCNTCIYKQGRCTFYYGEIESECKGSGFIYFIPDIFAENRIADLETVEAM